jgi:hypothetical protein
MACAHRASQRALIKILIKIKTGRRAFSMRLLARARQSAPPQGDRIGRIFAYRVTDTLGSFVKIAETAQIIGLLF